MGIFDIFTGDPAKEAAAQQRQYLSGLQSQVGNLYSGATSGGLEALRSAQSGALGAIGPAFAQGQGYLQQYLPQQLSALYGGQGAAEGALQGSQPQALAALGQGVAGAGAAYAPLGAAAGGFGAAYQPALQQYLGGLGIGGPQAQQAALQGFQGANPGYGFELGQGIDAITRAANATGMGASGNTLREAQNYGQNLANTRYQQYLQNLYQPSQTFAPLQAQALGQLGSGLSNAALTGGTGAANILTGTGSRLADLYGTTGRAGADIYGTAGRSLADLATRGGLAEADIYGRTGSGIAGLYGQLAPSQANALTNLGQTYAKSYTDEAQAQLQGSKNLWGLGLNLATMAATGGLGGGLSSLGSGLFGAATGNPGGSLLGSVSKWG